MHKKAMNQFYTHSNETYFMFQISEYLLSKCYLNLEY